ncbi:MAG TPA: glycosyltransferase family 9 protein [Phycisphaerae bacterium]
MFRITIVHQSALGDTILLVPLIRALRKRFAHGAQVHITIVTKTNLGQMLTMLGIVDGFASADDREHTLWFAFPEAPGEKANSMPGWADADLILCAVAGEKDAWGVNARLARRERAGSVGKGSDFGGGVMFFEPRPPADFRGHVTEWHRQQLAALELTEPEAGLARMNPDGAVLIHPGSGGDGKCWPRERFLSLGRTLKRNGIPPTFILGEVEQEKWGYKVIEELKREFSWYLHMGLFEVADRMSRGRLFVGNDSGVTHLAAMIGIPVIALFGPSNDVQWRPVGADVRILRAAVPEERDLGKLEEGMVLHEILSELRKM